jgi:hypothetical protein
VIEFAQGLQRNHAPVFAGNPRLKHRVAQLVKLQLPPQPGRPGLVIVTAAIRLLHDLRRIHPEKPAKEIWKEIYRRLIPNYARLSFIERRTAEQQLHQQVRWRLSARRRRRARLRGGSGKFTR